MSVWLCYVYILLRLVDFSQNLVSRFSENIFYLFQDGAVVWLSFLAVFVISHSKLYEKENKTVIDGT